MPQDLQAGDFLMFQLESGFGLLRFLGNTDRDGEKIWHITAYHDLFLDADSVDRAIANPEKLSINQPHLALTTRAFESTQVAGMGNLPLVDSDLVVLNAWAADKNAEVSDRSVRLLLGLR